LDDLDLEQINGRFRITIGLYLPKWRFSASTQKYIANDKQYTTTDTINHQ